MASILVVDDNASSREFLVSLLDYDRHHVFEAASGEEGLVKARHHHPELIITDIVMPTMDGFEFVRQLRTDPFIGKSHVIFYSASVDGREARSLATLAGVDHVLAKPAEPDLILQTVQAVLLHTLPEMLPSIGETFAREHMQLLMRKLSDKVDELEAVNQHLQTLSRRLLEVQEGERRRVARELHDEIGQALTAVTTNLQALAFTSSLPSELIQDSINTVGYALQQVRRMSLDLRPSLLDDFGLVPALEWYLERQQQRSGLQFKFVGELHEQRLPPDIETACFRLVQEAVTNVVRHAQARSVEVTLRRSPGQLELVVCDDGSGFDVAAERERALRGASMGILGMQERVLLVGGHLQIESALARGTKLRAQIPLRTYEDANLGREV